MTSTNRRSFVVMRLSEAICTPRDWPRLAQIKPAAIKVSRSYSRLRCWGDVCSEQGSEVSPGRSSIRPALPRSPATCPVLTSLENVETVSKECAVIRKDGSNRSRPSKDSWIGIVQRRDERMKSLNIAPDYKGVPGKDHSEIIMGGMPDVFLFFGPHTKP